MTQITHDRAEWEMSQRAAPLSTQLRLDVIMSIFRGLDGFKGGEELIEKKWDELMNIACTGDAKVTRRPFDRDDAAILQAAHNAGFPNAVFVENEMSLIDRVHMVHGEAPEPDWMTETRAQMADAKDLERTQEDARS